MTIKFDYILLVAILSLGYLNYFAIKVTSLYKVPRKYLKDHKHKQENCKEIH